MDKQLTRSTNDQMVAGVAAGIAEYTNIDPTIIRFLFALLTLCGGPGLVAYILLWIVMPEKNLEGKANM